jgi:hypothetical protein
VKKSFIHRACLGILGPNPRPNFVIFSKKTKRIIAKKKPTILFLGLKNTIPILLLLPFSIEENRDFSFQMIYVLLPPVY